MKVVFRSVFVFCLLLTTTLNFAQKKGKGWEMEFGIAPGIATNGGYSFGLGTDVRLQTEISEKLHFILTTGLTGFVRNTPANGMSYIPVKIGGKYFLGENLYTSGEVGIGFGLVKGSGRAFVWAPTLGLSFEKVDISIKYEDAAGFLFANNANTTYLENTTNKFTKQFALRVAYKFNLK
jgi:hypothetical protein